MLLDSNGREVRADNLPKNSRAREAVLANLREVLTPAPQRAHTLGGMFQLGTRAVHREVTK